MNDFTHGNVTRQITLFALPMLIGNIFQQLYSMVDAMIVGRFVDGSGIHRRHRPGARDVKKL